MKKMGLLLFLMLLLIGLVGCQQNDKLEGNSIITGEIVKIENGLFLVESSSEKLPDGRPNAIWFSDHIEALKVGQIVSVWTTSLNGSDPGAATADKVEIKE